jgi:hypothetical protein
MFYLINQFDKYMPYIFFLIKALKQVSHLIYHKEDKGWCKRWTIRHKMSYKNKSTSNTKLVVFFPWASTTYRSLKIAL